MTISRYREEAQNLSVFYDEDNGYLKVRFPEKKEHEALYAMGFMNAFHGIEFEEDDDSVYDDNLYYVGCDEEEAKAFKELFQIYLDDIAKYAEKVRKDNWNGRKHHEGFTAEDLHRVDWNAIDEDDKEELLGELEDLDAQYQARKKPLTIGGDAEDDIEDIDFESIDLNKYLADIFGKYADKKGANLKTRLTDALYPCFEKYATNDDGISAEDICEADWTALEGMDLQNLATDMFWYPWFYDDFYMVRDNFSSVEESLEECSDMEIMNEVLENILESIGEDSNAGAMLRLIDILAPYYAKL